MHKHGEKFKKNQKNQKNQKKTKNTKKKEIKARTGNPARKQSKQHEVDTGTVAQGTRSSRESLERSWLARNQTTG